MGESSARTITMLFSDIEGSTGLLRRLGERYGEVLSAQRDT
jgi:class 3 adenylate cyclase